MLGGRKSPRRQTHQQCNYNTSSQSVNQQQDRGQDQQLQQNHNSGKTVVGQLRRFNALSTPTNSYPEY